MMTCDDHRVHLLLPIPDLLLHQAPRPLHLRQPSLAYKQEAEGTTLLIKVVREYGTHAVLEKSRKAIYGRRKAGFSGPASCS
mmetsp:Transcript_91415/g.175999  ORF Transcript_91415/g.175999 Transcript_91415/m.175999 type:complete len:82 (+) Transcript_91415:203-448(+)